jgi:hypothetical protein
MIVSGADATQGAGEGREVSTAQSSWLRALPTRAKNPTKLELPIPHELGTSTVHKLKREMAAQSQS